MGQNLTKFRQFWNNLFDALVDDDEATPPPVTKPAPVVVQGIAAIERALSMSRLSEQLWMALNPEDDDDMWASGNWAWPLDVYMDEGQFFCIYSQAGLLYRVDLSVRGDTLMLGTRTQVTEAFPAVAQSKRGFFVARQADGRYRWTMIAGTTVLNRVGEIDSYELFDSFIEEAERSGEYPRLDYYHMGEVDPKAWEFGTADILARDGVCYLASGLFDEGHPLAEAVIQAAQRDDQEWGASIEFRAFVKAELIMVQGKNGSGSDPVEVAVPVYRKGKNTRISVLLESDAAGLFTTLGVNKETLRMRADILEKLSLVFGNDEEAEQFLEQFGQDVDRVNRTVEDKGLIHRAKKRTADAAAAADDATTDEDGPTDEEDDDEAQGQASPDLVLDDTALHAIADLVLASETFQSMHAALNAMSEQATAMSELLESREAALIDLKQRLARMTIRVKALEADDATKQQAWLRDLSAQRGSGAETLRPRLVRAQQPDDLDEGDDEDGGEETMADAADRTLATLPKW